MAKKDEKKSSSPPMMVFNKVVGFYKQIFAYTTSHDIQALHILYVLFWLTFLPLPLLYWAGFKTLLIVFIVLSPLWLPPLLITGIWHQWMDYIHLLYINNKNQQGALYEVVVPRDVQKSPKAMELFLEGLLLTQGETTEIDKYWKGRVRPWWSLEIAGINGEVRMYLWCWKRFGEYAAAQLYAQYPEVELREIPDYAAKVVYDPSKIGVWGMRYKLNEGEAFPIKTYFDYGLHENPDRWEVKIDPMVNMLERFALTREGEQLWFQILIKKSDRKVNEEADAAIKKIYDENTTEYTDFHDPDTKVKGMAMLTPGDREKVEAINRTRKKPSFDCVIRGIYIYPNDKIQPNNIQSLLKMLNHYSGYNSFGIDGKATGTDYPWGKWTGPDMDKVLKNFVNAYRLRSGFHPPYKRPSITLTTEELATIWHLPSQESKVPGQEKKQARTAEPPPNLPVV